ncbi:MAG: VWA domain-containing protein, partial [Myxococcales bacterium]|nr:VWA domain-containing protein [Myxococcales bacterium]
MRAFKMLVFFTIQLAATAAFATGPVLFAGGTDGAELKPTKAEGPFGAAVGMVEIAVDVAEDEAMGRTTMRVRGTPEGAHTLIVPLGPGHLEARARVDGKAVEGDTRTGAKADALWAALAKVTGSGLPLAEVGHGALVVPTPALGKRAVIELDQRWKIDATDGMRRLVVPLPAPSLAASLSRLRVEVTLRAAEPLRAVFSPSHDIDVERPDLRTAIVRFDLSSPHGDDDLTLLYAVDRDDLGLRVLTHRADDADHGYFMVLGNPTGRAEGDIAAPKDVVMVVDTSGSMRGEKMEQARSAMEYVLDHLGPDDRFNIIAFGTAVRPFRDAL